MFDNISGQYDTLNRVLSLGIDIGWRNTLVKQLDATNPTTILDVATGTGDLAIAAYKPGRKITGVDISTGMLNVGREKVKKRHLSPDITLVVGDSEALEFTDHSFDAVLAAFGVRNFENLEAGLTEMARVLKPGGFLGILEFGKPKSAIIRFGYNLYFTRVLPVIGKLVSRDLRAYTYLPESVNAFPYGTAFTEILSRCGFAKPKTTPLTFGICQLYTATKI